MSNEEKKQYLSKYRLLWARIRRLNEMLSSAGERSAPTLSRLEESRLLRDKIENEIDEVDGALLSEILSQKYLCGKSIEEISFALNYSKRQIERLHITALEKFRVT